VGRGVPPGPRRPLPGQGRGRAGGRTLAALPNSSHSSFRPPIDHPPGHPVAPCSRGPNGRSRGPSLTPWSQFAPDCMRFAGRQRSPVGRDHAASRTGPLPINRPAGARRDWLFEAGSSLRDSRASSAPRERRAVRSLSRFSFPSGCGPSVGGSDRNRVGPLRGSTRCRSLGLFPGTAGAVRRTATTGQTTPGWNAAETYPSPSRRAGTVAKEGPPSGWWSPTGKPREKRAMPAGGERQRWTLAQGGRSAAGNSPNRKFSSLRSPPSLPKTGRIGERLSRVGCL